MGKKETIDILKKPYNENINYYDYHSDEKYPITDVLKHPEKHKPVSNSLKTIGSTALGTAIGLAPVIAPAFINPSKRAEGMTTKKYVRATLPYAAALAIGGGLIGNQVGRRNARNQKFRSAISGIDNKLQKDILERDRQKSEWEISHAKKEQRIMDKLNELEDRHGDLIYKNPNDLALGRKERDAVMKYNNLEREFFTHRKKINPHYNPKLDSELKNKAIYDALKSYHKVASEELDLMYKRAYFIGGTGDAAAMGTMINDVMKNYNKGGGGMTGWARRKAGWGNVAGNIGKTVAKGATVGALAQVGANAVDNLTKPTQEDEYGRRVQASEILDEMWKEAGATTRGAMYGALAGHIAGVVHGARKAKQEAVSKKLDRKNTIKKVLGRAIIEGEIGAVAGGLAGAGLGAGLGAGTGAIAESINKRRFQRKYPTGKIPGIDYVDFDTVEFDTVEPK